MLHQSLASFFKKKTTTTTSSSSSSSQPNKRSKTNNSSQEPMPTAASPDLLTSLVAHPVWRKSVLPFLQPKHWVQLAAVDAAMHEAHSQLELWESLLMEVKAAKYLEALEKAHSLSDTVGNTALRAYLAAISRKCGRCRGSAAYINILALTPTCKPCFTAWTKTGIVERSTAHRQYALKPHNTDVLPHLTVHAHWGYRLGTVLSRIHVKALALATHGTMKAIREKKEAEQRAARAGHEYEKSMHEAKTRAAKARGLRAPNRLFTPKILRESLEIDQTKHGLYNYQFEECCKAVLFEVH